MCFVGIDPSLTATGIVAINLELHPFWVHTIQIGLLDNSWMEKVRRVDETSWQLRNDLSELSTKYGIDRIVLEGYSFGSHFQAHQLGELGGAFRHILLAYKAGTRIVPPRTVKKFITGSGRADKSWIHKCLYGMGFELPNSHTDDACACALLGLAMSGQRDDIFTTAQLEIARKCLKT